MDVDQGTYPFLFQLLLRSLNDTLFRYSGQCGDRAALLCGTSPLCSRTWNGRQLQIISQGIGYHSETATELVCTTGFYTYCIQVYRFREQGFV
jgi:hypothetical protein